MCRTVDSYDEGLEAGRGFAFLYKEWIDPDIAAWILDETNDLSEIEREVFKSQLDYEAVNAYEWAYAQGNARGAVDDFLNGFESGVREQVWEWRRESYGYGSSNE